ncbi:MAG: hypothetical protein ACW976_05800 [Candidatus Ranarchaeia archaeon]
MVTKVELFECDICHTRYEEKKRAKWCESLGKPKTKFKKGDMVIDVDEVITKPLIISEITLVNVKKADGSFEHRAFYACVMPGKRQPYTFKEEELKLAE